ncbi:rCG48746 [Rattus norvegicus]|uniref:RCG48746 n=1 Tax=Rattus norvegicus TaxID=10116 RepID=A6IG67_RAT|nr:rCG48746 [Rattus norvegicus]
MGIIGLFKFNGKRITLLLTYVFDKFCGECPTVLLNIFKNS